MASKETQSMVEAIWQIESPKNIARLVCIVGDVDSVEDLAQDTFVIALEQWPHKGLPQNPAGWLMVTARYRAIDRLRRDLTLQRKHAELGYVNLALQAFAEEDFDIDRDQDYSDDLLRLIFTACHPVLAGESRVA